MAQHLQAHDAYGKAGVHYGDIDTFKLAGQKSALMTSLPETAIAISEVPESRGESCFLIEFPDHYLAFLVEGLGTKNIVADLTAIAMASVDSEEDRTFYEGIGQDMVAMIVNDLATSGAQTLVVAVECAAGSSDWFKNQKRADDLIRGWTRAIGQAKGLYGPGETPVLKEVVNSEMVVLSGAAAGVIAPKSRRITGNIQPGDRIIAFTAPGVNANGLTLCRQLPGKMPVGYLTRLPDGQTYGEALLAPTPIYSTAVSDLRAHGYDIHYVANITGHGWRKLMRAKTAEKFSYVIDTLPRCPDIFQMIQKFGKVSQYDMYANFNMGAGYALMVPREEAERITAFVNQRHYGFTAIDMGHVEMNGSKQVVIPALNILFPEASLDL